MKRYVFISTDSGGIFYGKLRKFKNDTATLKNARRIFMVDWEKVITSDYDAMTTTPIAKKITIKYAQHCLNATKKDQLYMKKLNDINKNPITTILGCDIAEDGEV